MSGLFNYSLEQPSVSFCQCTAASKTIPNDEQRIHEYTVYSVKLSLPFTYTIILIITYPNSRMTIGTLAELSFWNILTYVIFTVQKKNIEISQSRN